MLNVSFEKKQLNCATRHDIVMFNNKKGLKMRKHVLIGMLFFSSVGLFAQTENKPTSATPNWVTVKEGVKMYELKLDGHSGVVIIDPESDKKEVKQSNAVVPAVKDTTKAKP